MIKKENNIQFRIMYFIGIVLIVAGHVNGTGAFSLFFEWFPPYSFHLALFVFCSGYFFINNKDIRIRIFLIKIIKKFLIPLYIWNLIYGIFCVFLRKVGFTFGVPINLKSLFILPIYDGHQFIFNLASWFIWPLFVVEFINIFVIKILKKNSLFYYVYFILSLFLGFAGIQMAINSYNTGWYLLIDRLLYFLPFFSAGMLYREKLETKDRINNYVYFSIIFLITLIIIYAFNGPIGYIISWCNNFDNFYRPFIVGFLGIAFWLRLSRIMVPILKNNKLVLYISNNTFHIMMHHFMGFFLLNTFYFILNRFFNFKDFIFSSYCSDIFYFYLPKGIVHFSILYIIAGIAYSLLVSFVLNKIKKTLIKSIK